MRFEINNGIWEIKQITDQEMQYDKGRDGYYTHGFTCYSENIIYINESSPEKERTLKHELTHVWLYMYGHCQDDKHFTNEDVCEIVASINNFINSIVGEYFKKECKNGRN